MKGSDELRGKFADLLQRHGIDNKFLVTELVIEANDVRLADLEQAHRSCQNVEDRLARHELALGSIVGLRGYSGPDEGRKHGYGVAADIAANALEGKGEAGRVLPLEMTPAIRRILGMPNFQCGPVANALRFGGEQIERAAEAEQAHVLWWLLGLAIDNPASWHDLATARIRQMRDDYVAKHGKGELGDV